MKQGFSIKDKALLGDREDLLAGQTKLDFFLNKLKSSGINSIEIRKLPRYVNHDDYESYTNAFRMIWEMGFEITVHGDLEGDFSGDRFVDVYPSMKYLLEHFSGYQSSITMTLHAYQSKQANVLEETLRDKTIKLLSDWTKRVEQENLPIKFALENNRRKATVVDPGNSCEGVVAIVNEVNNANLGICWDMGHYYSNLKQEGIQDSINNRLPSDEFLEKVCHTHIHGLNSEGVTHTPLIDESNLPLQSYINALKNLNYKGVYNLELSPERFENKQKVEENVFHSIKSLSDTLKKF